MYGLDLREVYKIAIEHTSSDGMNNRVGEEEGEEI